MSSGGPVFVRMLFANYSPHGIETVSATRLGQSSHFPVMGSNFTNYKFYFELFDIFLQEQYVTSTWEDNNGEMFFLPFSRTRLRVNDHRYIWQHYIIFKVALHQNFYFLKQKCS
jgi:hypothetical protein